MRQNDEKVLPLLYHKIDDNTQSISPRDLSSKYREYRPADLVQIICPNNGDRFAADLGFNLAK